MVGLNVRAQFSIQLAPVAFGLHFASRVAVAKYQHVLLSLSTLGYMLRTVRCTHDNVIATNNSRHIR
jgi:hypothetical protein